MDWKTEDATARFEHADIMQNRGRAVCAYLGVLVLVPLFGAKNSGFARFHADQGLALLVAGLAYNFIVGILATAVLGFSWGLYPLLRIIRLLGLFFPVLAIAGICNAARGKAKELPVIGKLRLLR